MARRPYRREAIEAALPADLRDALPTLCRLNGIPPADWPELPALRQLFETAAVVRTVALLQAHDPGLSRESAMMTACFRLGLSFDTIATRLARNRRRRKSLSK